MDNKNKNNNKNKKKLPFGRNLFTLIFITVSVVVLAFVISTITSYVTASNKSKYAPFETKSITNGTEEKYEDGTFNSIDSRMKDDKFNTFGINLRCTSYVEDENTSATTRQAIYKLSIYKNDNTPSIKNGKVNVAICMAAPWVGFIKYPSSAAPKELEFCDTEENAKSTSPSNYKTFTISNQIDFPAKVNTFPIPITVDCPTIYLYLSYVDSYSKTTTVVLEYSYYDIIPEAGGINK